MNVYFKGLLVLSLVSSSAFAMDINPDGRPSMLSSRGSIASTSSQSLCDTPIGEPPQTFYGDVAPLEQTKDVFIWFKNNTDNAISFQDWSSGDDHVSIPPCEAADAPGKYAFKYFMGTNTNLEGLKAGIQKQFQFPAFVELTLERQRDGIMPGAVIIVATLTQNDTDIETSESNDTISPLRSSVPAEPWSPYASSPAIGGRSHGFSPQGNRGGGGGGRGGRRRDTFRHRTTCREDAAHEEDMRMDGCSAPVGITDN